MNEKAGKPAFFLNGSYIFFFQGFHFNIKGHFLQGCYHVVFFQINIIGHINGFGSII